MALGPRYITANICGGLGNQYFQIANLIATTARSNSGHGGGGTKEGGTLYADNERALRGIEGLLAPPPSATSTRYSRGLRNSWGGQPISPSPVLQMVMERSAWSDSIDTPRATYWDSAFSRFCEICPSISDVCGEGANTSSSQNWISNSTRLNTMVVGEQRPLGRTRCLLPFPSAETNTDKGLRLQAPPPMFGGPSVATAPHLYSLVGFFQSTYYFSDYENLVREILIDPSLVCIGRSVVRGVYGGEEEDFGSEDQQRNAQEQGKHNCHQKGNNKNCCHYVAMHIRRGDYLVYSDTFETLQLEQYYYTALEQLFGPLLLLPNQNHLHHCHADTNADLCVRNEAKSNGASSNSPPSPPPPLQLKLLIFTDEYGYGLRVAQKVMDRYPALDAMVVDEETEKRLRQSCRASPIAKVPTQYRPTSFFGAQFFLEDDAKKSSSSVPLFLSERSLPRDVLELYMMASCDDVILANSTFSWWGAYLNDGCFRPVGGDDDTQTQQKGERKASALRLGRVVAPSKWFVREPFPLSSHLYAKGWMVM